MLPSRLLPVMRWYHFRLCSTWFYRCIQTGYGICYPCCYHESKCSQRCKAIEPGKYTVILEPVAATYMLENMFRFDARSAEEGRSFLSKKGGGTRLGEQLMDPKVTIYSDPFNPDLPGAYLGW
jgi:hypothetical protein